VLVLLLQSRNVFVQQESIELLVIRVGIPDVSKSLNFLKYEIYKINHTFMPLKSVLHSCLIYNLDSLKN
jgi:hypothetical protein